MTVNSTKVGLRQTTRYPWGGGIKLSVEAERETTSAIYVRLPGWCGEPRLQVNGQPLVTFEQVRDYAHLQRNWQLGDVIELSLPMPVQRLKAHPKVEANRGRVALQRGPILYCLEAVDNGGFVRNLVIPPQAQLRAPHRADLLGGVTVIQGAALALNRVEWPDALYLPEPTASDDATIPRFTWWDHRGTKEWVQYDFDGPQKVSTVEVYWWDERRIKADCRVPQSWRLLYKDGDQWKAVSGTSQYGTKMDGYNRVTFDPVVAGGLRIEVQLQSNWSGGILEWRVE
jgi:hypothetical protein